MAVTVQTPSGMAARSQHTSDSSVQPFTQEEFDPADYMNSTLPSLSVAGPRTTQQVSTRGVTLPELSAQLQTILSRLNTQTSRLSTTLTQLTDEILRSGGRLAYEVEVLRGETNGLVDAMTNGLKKDTELFAPSNAVRDEGSGDATKLLDPTSEPPKAPIARACTITP